MPAPSADSSSFVAQRQAAYASLFTPSQLDDLMAVYADDVVYSDYSWGAINMDKEAHTAFFKVRADPASLFPRSVCRCRLTS